MFDALRRKETYATSGPRIALRFFGAQELPTGLCADESRIAVAREKGVPMGGTLSSGATFFVEATVPPPQPRRDHQGRIDADGTSHQDVISLSAPADASVDPSTCTRSGDGFERISYGLDGPLPRRERLLLRPGPRGAGRAAGVSASASHSQKQTVPLDA